MTHNFSTGQDSSKIVDFGPAFNKEFLFEVFQLQQELEQLGQEDDKGLEKLCFAPMVQVGETTKLWQCTVQSIFGYFNNDINLFNSTSTNNEGYVFNYLNTLENCFLNPLSLSCLAPYGGPVEPAIAVGGMPQAKSGENQDYKLATGIVLTFLLNNNANKSELGPAMEWEKLFVDYLENYSSDVMEIAYSAERSIEDGIDAMSEAELWTVIISYLVMFLYITIALGKIRNLRTVLLESKITLAIGGIVIVLASVLCSLGVFGYLKVATTMLTVEVIPFLVLAVGVDNIFILVHTYNRLNKHDFPTIADGIGEALGRVGPSILLTAASECFCFLIGALSDMPAVRTFALYATVALFLNFIFQISAFIALMAIDEKRLEGGRLDLFCCFRTNSVLSKEASNGFLQNLFEKYYTPFLLAKPTRFIVVLIFLAMGCFSLIVTPSIEVGLDQELSMPKDSHIVKYFQYMADLLSMGPPVYFVIESGLNYEKFADQNLICGGVLCDVDSLNIQLYIASKYPEVTKIARPSSSWLDDYIDWLSISTCCKVNSTDGSFCLSSGKFMKTFFSILNQHKNFFLVRTSDCVSCQREFDDNGIRPTEETFKKYIPYFLSDLPDENCAKAGRAAYAPGLNYISEDNEEHFVKDSYFMSYHTTVITSRQFYTSLKKARELSDDIAETFRQKGLELKVFAYSIFYVYYEQYLTIWFDALVSLGLSLAAVFVVTFIVTGKIIN